MPVPYDATPSASPSTQVPLEAHAPPRTPSHPITFRDGSATARETKALMRRRPRRALPYSAEGRLRLVQAALVVIAATTAALPDGPLSLLRRAVLLPAVPALTTVLCLGAARRHGGPVARDARAGWTLLAAASAVATTAAVLAAATGARGRDLPPWDLVDGLQLLFYPLTAVGVWILLRSRTPRWLPTMWWDGAAVALAVLALGLGAVSVLAVTPSGLPWVAGVDGHPGHLALGLGYPLADVLGLAAVLGAAAVIRTRASAILWWLAAGVALLLLSDIAACALAQREAGAAASAGSLGLVEVGWALASVAVGLAVPTPARDRRRAPRAGQAFNTALTDTPAMGLRPLVVEDGAGARRARLAERARTGALPTAAVLSCLLIVAVALIARPVTPWVTLPALTCVAVGLFRLGTTLWTERGGAQAHLQGLTDDVTGLANRRAVTEVLTAEALGTDPLPWDADGELLVPDGDDRVALLLADLDRFKDVNDALGHEAGDQLLAAVGERLSTVLRRNQMLARLGGDEFAVVLPGAGADSAVRIAQALRQSLGAPFVIGGNRLHVQASIGVAAARLTRDEPADLLRQADVAMYAAKRTIGGIATYDADGDHHGPDRLRRIDELRKALDHGDLEVHVQPQVDLRTGRIVGVEALARWRHPVDGVLLPQAFLPLAAQTGLVRPVARLMLDSALAACGTWWWAGHHIPVAVNLTADDLADGGAGTRVEEALARHGLPGKALHLEITEEAMLADRTRTAALLQRWRALGVRVAMDDYGTGYSSLAYLRELPLDVLKIDQVFVRDLHRRTTTTIVRHTVAMAHGLGLRVVAEGIEDETTVRALADLQVDVGQGLFFGGAVTPQEFLARLPAAQV
ncbi:MAG: bifunctional diguanylate cyclase/phosphodiesterase [Kineosporiaceae bacterium]